MAPKDRQQWILNWMRQQAPFPADVLNKAFVDDYIDATRAEFKLQMFGANTCRQLGRDLSALHARGQLSRSSVGLPTRDSSMGFPKWVYSYSIHTE